MRYPGTAAVCIMRSFRVCTTPVITSRRMRWAEHVARMGTWRGEWGVLVGKTGIEPTGRPTHRRQNIKCILKNWMGCGQIWFRMGRVGRHMQTWYWTVGFYKMRGFWLRNYLASEELCSMDMVRIDSSQSGFPWRSAESSMTSRRPMNWQKFRNRCNSGHR